MEDGCSCCFCVESGESVREGDDCCCCREEEVEVGGVIEDSRLLRKSRSSASAFSSRVNCRLGLVSDIDGCCCCCVGRLSGCCACGCAFWLLEDDRHHQPIVNIFIEVVRPSSFNQSDIQQVFMD